MDGMRIREREQDIRDKYSRKKLKTDESTYHYSATEKEAAFIKAQFPTPEELEKYWQYRNEWHRRAEAMEAGDKPLAVICELVSSCNLKCEMCYTINPQFQESVVGLQRVLPWDRVVAIIDECAEIGVYSMLFSWRGESTMYRSKDENGQVRDFADVLAYARGKGILEVTSLTNGRMLNEQLIRKIVQAQPNWISFSIDGLGETYGKIRKARASKESKDPFTEVTDNLKTMIRIRDELGLTRPQVRTNTIYPTIADNPELYRRTMEEMGVGLVTVNELLDFRGEDIPEDAILKDWFCQYPFQRLAVGANGVIMACPGAHREGKEIVLGRYVGCKEKVVIIDGREQVQSAPEKTLREAWQCDGIKKLRDLHRSNRRTEITACKHCRHGAVKHGVDWIPEDWDMVSMEWNDRVWRNN